MDRVNLNNIHLTYYRLNIKEKNADIFHGVYYDGFGLGKGRNVDEIFFT